MDQAQQPTTLDHTLELAIVSCLFYLFIYLFIRFLFFDILCGFQFPGMRNLSIRWPKFELAVCRLDFHLVSVVSGTIMTHNFSNCSIKTIWSFVLDLLDFLHCGSMNHIPL